MKKITALLTAVALIAGLCACSAGNDLAAWQEQFDSGMRSLSEGKYEEAASAFTSAVEMDPKRAETYIGLADVYEALGDVERARQALRDGLRETGDTRISDQLTEMEARIQQEEEEKRLAAMELLADCPYTGDRSQWRIPAEQAGAYARVIQNAMTRCDTDEFWFDAMDREVYAALVDIDGNTLLWITAVAIENDWYGPNTIPCEDDDLCMYIMFEEVWEWDGARAVQFSPASDRAHFKLRPNGLEAFTHYGGTDVDGNEWDALYPFSNGRISDTPEWCRAWAWVYEYKLDYYHVRTAGKDKSEIAQALISSLIYCEEWPDLPFDWSTMSILDFGWDVDFRVDLSGGTGYEEFYTDIRTDPDYHELDWPGLSYSSGELLSAGDITAQDGGWGAAASVMDCLTAYAQAG